MADLPALQDPRLDFLVGVWAEAARNLETALDGLLIEADGPRRFLLYQRILNILNGLRGQTDEWNRTFIEDFYREADQDALRQLEASGITAQLGASINEEAVNNLVRSITNTLHAATSSVEHLATKVFRSTALEREFPELDRAVRRQVAVGMAQSETTAQVRLRIAGLLRAQFRDGPVSVIGVGGRRFTFPMDYYAGMVASATKRQARTVATLVRSQEAQSDLVRISPNPSKGGDYCDAYAGRVFSVSGSHPIYPPLALTPNGGPPFHPWCRHSISVFIPEAHTTAEQAAAADVDERFLMTPSEENPNRIIRNWWHAKREGTATPRLTRG